MTPEEKIEAFNKYVQIIQKYGLGSAQEITAYQSLVTDPGLKEQADGAREIERLTQEQKSCAKRPHNPRD